MVKTVPAPLAILYAIPTYFCYGHEDHSFDLVGLPRIPCWFFSHFYWHSKHYLPIIVTAFPFASTTHLPHCPSPEHAWKHESQADPDLGWSDAELWDAFLWWRVGTLEQCGLIP